MGLEIIPANSEFSSSDSNLVFDWLETILIAEFGLETKQLLGYPGDLGGHVELVQLVEGLAFKTAQ